MLIVGLNPWLSQIDYCDLQPLIIVTERHQIMAKIAKRVNAN